MADSVITDEMRAALGVEMPGVVSEVTTSGIRMFARAVGFTDPIFYEEAEAKRRGYRGLVAPPGYLGTPRYGPPKPDERQEPGGQFKIPYKRALNGGTFYTYLAPVIAGDVITARSKVTDFQERVGSIGPMLITYRETVYTNQDGVMVAKMRGNGIQY